MLWLSESAHEILNSMKSLPTPSLLFIYQLFVIEL